MNEFTELKIAKKLCEWVKKLGKRHPELLLLFATPNTSTDFFLPVPRWGYHGLFIKIEPELSENEELSKIQFRSTEKDWLKNLKDQGYLIVITYGFADTVKLILTYLNPENYQRNLIKQLFKDYMRWEFD